MQMQQNTKAPKYKMAKKTNGTNVKRQKTKVTKYSQNIPTPGLTPAQLSLVQLSPNLFSSDFNHQDLN